MPKKLEPIDGKLICNVCKLEKNTSEFYAFGNSWKRPCKECKLEKSSLDYFSHTDDPIKFSLESKQKRENFAKQRLLYESYEDYKKAYNKNYLQINSKKIKIYESKRNLNPLTKLKRRMHFSKITLPYPIEDLKNHIENLFEKDWMSWNNWSIYDPKTWNDNDKSTWTWNIDHIIPKSDLPYSSHEEENFKICWALENLRPYSAKDNIIDGARRTRHNKKKV